MVKSPPAAAFKMSQPEFLLQFLVVALDDPALFSQCYQVAQRDILPQIGHPVLGRLSFTAGPLLRSRRMQFVVPMRSGDVQTIETRA